MNKIVKLPEELNELALKVPESKQNEVKKVLNDIFLGTADWERQVDLIEVKNINDIMSIQLADVARKNAKTARLSAEKIFDKKRTEVQLRMMDDKLEDALWLKSKQIMQLQFKHIEEKAKFKSEFGKRYESEQLQLRNDLRCQKVLKYIPDEEISILEIGQMSDNIFEAYLSGVKKTDEDKVAAEKKAEEDRIAKEREEKAEQERIRKENERLRKEAEVAEANRIKEEKERQRLAEIEADKLEADRKEQEHIRLENQAKAKAELKKVEAEKQRLIAIEKAKADKLEADRKEQEHIRLENQAKAKAELKKVEAEKQRLIAIEKAKVDKLEAELEAKKQSEIKAENDRLAAIEADAKKGDAAKVSDLIDDLNVIKTKYQFKSKKNQKMYADVSISINKLINHIEK